MMKRILCSLTAFLLLLGVGEARAQQQTTVSIPEVVGEAGTTVSVPINVTNFTNVGSIQLAIEYDQDALTFVDVSNFAGDGLQANATDGVLRLAFASLDGIDIASGKLLDMNFTFEGGTEELVFDTAESEITDVNNTPLNVTFDSGFVAEQASTISLGSVSDVQAGDTVRVPLAAVDAISGVGAVSLVVNYDGSVLRPADDLLVNTAEGFDQILAASPSTGQVNIEGYSTSGVDLDGTFAELQFVAEGGSSTLSFGADSDVATLEGEVINIRFRSGSVVAAGAEVGTISIPDLDAQAGTDIVVPLEVDSIANVGSVTLVVTYDAGVLSFQEATDFDAFGANNAIVNSPEPGEIRLVGFSTAGVELAGVLANLHFSYTGGDSEIEFDESVSVVSTPAGDPIFVMLEGGSVSERQPQADVVFNDQTSSGQVVTVDSVALSDGGFVAIHDTTLLEGVVLGSVIGVSSYLEAGTHEDVQITLFQVPGLDTTATMLTMDQRLIAMPHLDTNGNQTYDFLTSEGAEDGAYVEGGSAVTDVALVQVLQEVSIAEARELPVGSQVAVEGTVTRAMGRNIWIQDETAGIVLFSFDGEFPVATEVEGGDLVRVTGELDEFNGLLEILPDTIEVLDDNAGVPEPQQVTAGELIEDCESYESELVQIDRLRFTAAAAEYDPVTFDAGTSGNSYDVFGAVEDTITVRIQRPSDTQFDGYTVDENTFSYLGVVGQFRDDCQLMPVLTGTDIFNVRATANEGPTELPQEFALHGNYPNPFNPSTTISFDLPAPAEVTITLYDVMGREVMAVSKGTMAPGAEQSVEFDAAGLGSGVYLYRVVAVSGDETHASTGKMVLVK